MTSRHSVPTNPFSDTAAILDPNHENILESTLPVGKDASLTLSADGVIITGQQSLRPLNISIHTDTRGR
jgi:hypothetical protein